MASPMPEPAPVTIAILSFRRSPIQDSFRRQACLMEKITRQDQDNQKDNSANDVWQN
jgi:hypothetical protein